MNRSLLTDVLTSFILIKQSIKIVFFSMLAMICNMVAFFILINTVVGPNEHIPSADFAIKLSKEVTMLIVCLLFVIAGGASARHRAGLTNARNVSESLVSITLLNYSAYQLLTYSLETMLGYSPIKRNIEKSCFYLSAYVLPSIMLIIFSGAVLSAVDPMFVALLYTSSLVCFLVFLLFLTGVHSKYFNRKLDESVLISLFAGALAFLTISPSILFILYGREITNLLVLMIAILILRFVFGQSRSLFLYLVRTYEVLVTTKNHKTNRVDRIIENSSLRINKLFNPISLRQWICTEKHPRLFKLCCEYCSGDESTAFEFCYTSIADSKKRMIRFNGIYILFDDQLKGVKIAEWREFLSKFDHKLVIFSAQSEKYKNYQSWL